MIARYKTTCQKCRRAVLPGQEITWVGRKAGHLTCPVTPTPTKPWTQADNLDWARMKNEFARLEQAQENAAYEAEMRREAELFEKHEQMPPP